MNIVTPFAAHLLPATTYQAWRVLPDGTSQPLDLLGRTNLADVTEAALQACQHKDHFTVLETKPTGKVEHVFYCKQGKPIWVRKEGFAHPIQVRPLEAELRFSRKIEELKPVELWRWTPGCDVVGDDRSVVEAR